MATNKLLDVQDPALLAIAVRAAATVNLATLKGAAHQAAPAEYPIADTGSVEQAFAKYLQQLPDEKRQQVTQRAQRLLAADHAAMTATFPELAQIDLRSPKAVSVQAHGIPHAVTPPLNLLDLHKVLHQSAGPTQPVFRRFGLHPQQGSNVINLFVDQIHCEKVTGILGLQNDDIFLGGVTVDTLGNVEAITPFEVGSFDGGTDRAVPRSPFAVFPVETGTNWPKAYSVTMVLAERHSGGIYDFVYKLAAEARSQIVQKLTEYALTAVGTLVGSAIGAAAGSIIPGLGTFIGGAVGAIVGWAISWVIGKVWDWIKGNLFGDDIFAPATMNLMLGSPGDSFGGSADGPQEWHLTGYHGDYRIRARWNLAWGDPNVNALWHMAWENDHWSGWESLGGVLNFDAAAASWSPGRLDLFVIGGDNQLWHKWYDNRWGDWEPLGGELSSGPAAVAQTVGRIDITARGQDAAVWHIAWDTDHWSSWESLGGTVISAPACCSWASGRLDVFAIGQDKQLWHKWYDNGWHDWEPLGGELTSGPAAVVQYPGRLDVVARGTDNAVWHIAWDTDHWSSWESLGGTISYRPAIASWGRGRLDIFAVGQDSVPWHKWYDNGWNDWEQLSGVLTSSPTAIAQRVGRIDVVGRGQ